MIHPGKTNVLSNQSDFRSETKKKMSIDEIWIEILTISESVRYLSQLITFQQQDTTEIKNRTRTVLTTFHKYRQEVTSKYFLLKRRLRLFDAAITPTICYASGTWISFKEHERMIQSMQREILRLILKTKEKQDTKRSWKTKLRPSYHSMTRTVTYHSD